MSIDLGVLIVSSSSPSGNIKTDADKDDWIWLNPDTGELKRFNPSTGQYDINIPVKVHTHDTFTGDIDMTDANVQMKNLNITQNLFMNGDNGANADITIGGYHLVVKEGIITTLVAV